MAKTSQLIAESSVHPLELRTFKQTASHNPMDKLAPDYGIVYVTSITRDRCSGCAEQKPLFTALAGKASSKHEGRVSFNNIHIQYTKEDESESAEAKKLLGHAAYPTYMIHVKSRFGPLEAYRAVYPSMEELEKQIEESLDLAEFYQEDATKAQ